jgi:hypothetical protein
MTPIRDALEPCPFCNGAAESDSQQHYRNITTGNLEKAAAVYCTACEAHMTWCYRDTPEIEREQVMELLVERWNTRATLTTPAPGRDALARIAKEAREAAAVLSVERVQGWANPLVTAIVKAADALDELAGNGKPAMDVGAPDVVLSAPQPGRDELRERIARIIDPAAFKKWDNAQGSWRKDEAKAACWEAEEKADAILSALPVATVVDEHHPYTVRALTADELNGLNEALISSGELIADTVPVVDGAGIRADEREKCAQIAEAVRVTSSGHPQIDGPTPGDMQRAIAQAIRAGGGKR